MLKLFSSGGGHAIERDIPSTVDRLIAWGKRPTVFTINDVIKTGIVLGIGALAFVGMISVAKADLIKEEPTPMTQAAEVEVVEAMPVAEPVMITINQTEALAMGIDAVISSEVKSEWASDATMIMVGNVIVNRANDSRYPDTVDQVLCQPYQFSCFSETGMKWVGRAATDEAFRARCIAAAEAVMAGERMLSHSVVYVSGTKQGAVEAQLDGLYFCR